MFDAGHFVLILVNDRLQRQWIKQSDRMALEFPSRPVRGHCNVVSPEYACLACVYRVIGLMKEKLLERGSRTRLVFVGDGETAEMTGLQHGQSRERQTSEHESNKGWQQKWQSSKQIKTP